MEYYCYELKNKKKMGKRKNPKRLIKKEIEMIISQKTWLRQCIGFSSDLIFSLSHRSYEIGICHIDRYKNFYYGR